MKRYNYWFFLLLIAAASCAPFASQRSFLTEMEQDDAHYYEPNRDFPVVAGDTGRFWNTEKERKARTPSSMENATEYRSRHFLDEELKTLESKQSESALATYQKYQDRLATTSEKIYFLKLPLNERRDYLESRGFLGNSTNPSLYTSKEKLFAIRESDILLGMSKNEVMGSWGKPLKVEIAGNPSYQNERWLYQVNGATKYIYFESGHVEGWE